MLVLIDKFVQVTKAPTHFDRWQVVAPCILFILTCIYHLSLSKLDLDLHHDLIMFSAALSMLNGELPFEDFFYQYNLGAVALHAAFLKTLGATVTSLKTPTAVFYALTTLIIYFSLRYQFSNLWSFLFAGSWPILTPFVWSGYQGYHPWPTVYMMFFVMLGGLLICLAIPRKSFVLGFFSGASFAIAFWMKQIAALQIIFLGVYLFYGALFTASQTVNRPLFLSWVLGGLVASLPVALYFISNDLFVDWWTSAIVYNSNFAVQGDSAKSLLHTIMTFVPMTRQFGHTTILWAVLPVAAICYFVFHVKNCGLYASGVFCKRSIWLLLTVVGYVQYFPLPDPFHTHLFLAPAWVALSLFVFDLTRARQSVGYYLIMSLAVFCLATEGLRHIWAWNQKTSASREVYFGGPLDGMKLVNANIQKLDHFISAIKEQNSRPIINLSINDFSPLVLAADATLVPRKMKQYWTWPNDIVEPGSLSDIAAKVQKKELPILSNTPIYLEGYQVKALLNYASPLTNYHTLLAPETSDQTFIDLHHVKTKTAGGSVIIELPALREIENFCSDLRSIILYRAGLEQIPKKITENQYERYLLKVLDKKTLEAIFSPYRDGYIRSVSPPQESIEAYLQFMLATGEDFAVQKNFPFLVFDFKSQFYDPKSNSLALIDVNTFDSYMATQLSMGLLRGDPSFEMKKHFFQCHSHTDDFGLLLPTSFYTMDSVYIAQFQFADPRGSSVVKFNTFNSSMR